MLLVEHESECLRHNPLGDPFRRTVEVHLPPGYDESRSYPVVYWLSGFGARPTLATRPYAFGSAPIRRLHQAMLEGSVPAALLVVPDCTTAFGGSQYIDSPGCGAYAQYLAEVVDVVDHRFATVPGWRARAVAGKSSGGYGALIAGMTSPLFGSVLAHSPDAGFEHCYLPLLPSVLDHLGAAGGLEHLLAQRESGPHDASFMVAMSLVAMGVCYSSRAGLTAGQAFVCDPVTGRFRDEVWQQWLRHDPVRMVADHVHALSSLALLHIDVGQRDEYGMHWGARALHATLEQHGLPHRYREHAGGHHGIEHVVVEALAALKEIWPQHPEPLACAG
nr:alpha/beta hydrolase-fold protein [Kineosporia babensis]